MPSRATSSTSLEEENRHLLDWETTVADPRIHGTIRQQVGKLFADVERAGLAAAAAGAVPVLPRRPAARASRRARRSGQGLLLGAAGVPGPARSGCAGTTRLVRIFNERWEQIALHVEREPGRFSTQGQHLAAEKISGVERGAAWLLSKVRRLGPQSSRWAEAMIATRGIEGVRVLQGLLEPGQAAPGRGPGKSL